MHGIYLLALIVLSNAFVYAMHNLPPTPIRPYSSEDYLDKRHHDLSNSNPAYLYPRVVALRAYGSEGSLSKESHTPEHVTDNIIYASSSDDTDENVFLAFIIPKEYIAEKLPKKTQLNSDVIFINKEGERIKFTYFYDIIDHLNLIYSKSIKEEFLRSMTVFLMDHCDLNYRRYDRRDFFLDYYVRKDFVSDIIKSSIIFVKANKSKNLHNNRQDNIENQHSYVSKDIFDKSIIPKIDVLNYVKFSSNNIKENFLAKQHDNPNFSYIKTKKEKIKFTYLQNFIDRSDIIYSDLVNDKLLELIDMLLNEKEYANHEQYGFFYDYYINNKLINKLLYQVIFSVKTAAIIKIPLKCTADF